MFFAIRVAVAASIMIVFHRTLGFDSTPRTLVMAFAAALAGQAAALAVKLVVGDQPRSRRAVMLLGSCVIVVLASVAFVVIDR